MAKNLKEELFAFATACGIAEAECKAEGVFFDDIKKYSLSAVHHIITNFGLFDEYIEYLTENTGIDAGSYFDIWVRENTKNEKKEVTKKTLFDEAFKNGMMYAHAKAEYGKNPTAKMGEVAFFLEAQVDMLQLFIKEVGMEKEYNKFLGEKLMEALEL